MRKTFVVPLLALVAVAFVAPGTAGADMKKEGKTTIRLSAFPDVKTAGEGKATFDLSKDGSSIHYKLDVDKSGLVAHFRCGDKCTPVAKVNRFGQSHRDFAVDTGAGIPACPVITRIDENSDYVLAGFDIGRCIDPE